MTDRPIIFSAPMVRALLEGRKTQTRRLIKRGPVRIWLDSGFTLNYINDPGNASVLPYQRGDRLWVREAFAEVGTCDPGWLLYRASGYEAECARHGFDRPYASEAVVKWRPSIHMPRWASRITLTVIDVRVQELLDISEEDAAAEGCSEGRFNDGFGPTPIGNGLTIESPGGFYSAAGAFQMLWQKIHPDWDGFSSPWVVALTFAVEQRNIDA